MKWLVLVLLAFSTVAEARVVCRNFDVDITTEESKVLLHEINTNLPSNTVIEVRIEGTAKTEDETRRATYYKNGRYLRNWSSANPIIYDKPRDGYKIANNGVPAEETITLQVTVPPGQVNQEFGLTNQNLIGCGAEKVRGRREIIREWVLAKRDIKIASPTIVRPISQNDNITTLNQKQIEFTGSVANQVSQIAAVTAVAAIKGRDCEWAIKVTEEMEVCRDFLRYITEGGPYDQATAKFKELDPDEIARDGVTVSEINNMVRDAKKVNQYRNLALTYLQSR